MIDVHALFSLEFNLNKQSVIFVALSLFLSHSVSLRKGHLKLSKSQNGMYPV